MSVPVHIKAWRYISHLPFYKKSQKLHELKDNSIVRHIEKENSSIIGSLKLMKPADYVVTGQIPRHIFILWWQDDFEDAGNIVSTCIKRVKQMEEYGFEIRIITKNNIKEYIDLSDILPIFYDKRISIQTLSDIIRCRLLYAYGGFWLDATIAITNKTFLCDIVDNYSFFTIRLKNFVKWESITEGRFTGFFWATVPHNFFFKYVSDMMTYYIINHSKSCDYFLIDYSIMVGYNNSEIIRNLIDSVPYSNPDLWYICNHMNDEVDEGFSQKLFTDNSVFKLNRRDKTLPSSRNYFGWLLNLIKDQD